MVEKRINPFIEKCTCGNKVTDHHFKCNKCWGETAKWKHRKKMKKLLEPLKKRLRGE